MGLSEPSTVRGLEWLCNRGAGGVPILQPDRLAYVGLRDIDVYERKILHRLQKEHGLFASTMQVRRMIGAAWLFRLEPVMISMLLPGFMSRRYLKDNSHRRV